MRAEPTIAAMVAAALVAGGAAAQQSDASMERCFGVALAGENDGVGAEETPGGATQDYQGDAWTWTPAGTCATIRLPPQADGTPRRGAIEPLRRDLP